MHLILTGATGLVGTATLQAMLKMNNITRVSILSRRPVEMAKGNSKVDVIIHKDFETYDPELLDRLQGADGCVWALGVSQNDVNKKEYYKVTHDYTLSAAKAFSTLSPSFNFVFVSGEGATQSPGKLTPLFGRVKGQTESDLLQFARENPTLKVYSARPGVVDASQHPEIQSFIPQRTLPKNIMLSIIPVMRAFAQKMVSPTKELGETLVKLTIGDGERLEGMGIEGDGRIVTNVGLRRLAGI